MLSVLILGMLHHGRTGDVPEAIEAQASTLLGHFLALVPEVAGEVGMALGPLVGLFVIFRIFLLRLTRYQTIRMAVGLVYTFLGLVCFFVGVKGGFIPAGRELGGILAQHDFRYFLILAGVVLGALAVCAEPASGCSRPGGGSLRRHIKRTVMLVSLCIGVAAAVGMAMLRVVTGMSIWCS